MNFTPVSRTYLRKLTKKLININSIAGSYWVNSREFYNHIGLSRKHYYEWVRRSIEDNPIMTASDAFRVPNAERIVIGKTGGGYAEYYLSLPVAVGLCVVAKTKEAGKIKEYLKTKL